MQETAHPLPNIYCGTNQVTDDNLTEEQNHRIKELLSRLHRHRVIAAYAYAGIVLGMIPILLLFVPSSTVYSFIGVITLNGFGAYKAFRWATKRFARQLSPTERTLLDCASDVSLTSREKNEFQELIQECQQISPQSQYLRASSRTADDSTLLRAATHTNETPREELLRAAQHER